MDQAFFEAETRWLFDCLPSSVRRSISEFWIEKVGSDEIVVQTDPVALEAFETDDVLGYRFDIAATNGHILFFRIDAVQDCGEDYRLIIFHELAHCYYFAKKRITLKEYRENEILRNKNEKDVDRLSRLWLKNLKRR